MINPIVIIVSTALILSVIVVYIFNKPKKPILTGTFILLLICFVIITWIIDNTISSFNSTQQFMDIVKFITMLNNPTYTQLENAFDLFMVIDIIFFVLSLISLLFEAMNILKKDRQR